MADETQNNPAAPEGEARPTPEKKPKSAPKKKDAEVSAPAVESKVSPPAVESTSTASAEVHPKEAKPASASRKPAKKDDKKEGTPAGVALSLDENIEPLKIVKAKGSKNVVHGIAHVQASFNNTIVSITDQKGAVIGWSSAGKCGFKGSRKSTAYAAQMVAQDACKQAMSHGLREVEVRVKGPGAGRESAVRAMQAVGLEITLIRDVTPVPHNGCRPPKQRRV